MGEEHGHGHGHDTEVLEGAPAPSHGMDGGSRLFGPSDVRNQVFTVVRLREGYDLSEVDGFLGRVESAMTRMLRENEELKTRLAAASHAALHTAPPAGERAARIVEIAEEAADRLIATARKEAEAIVAQARDRAESPGRDTLEKFLELQREAQSTRREAVDRRLQDLQALVSGFDGLLRQCFDDHSDQLLTMLEELLDPAQALKVLHPQRPEAGQCAGNGDHPAEPCANEVSSTSSQAANPSV
jgi:DivIVA domain-containing protein